MPGSSKKGGDDADATAVTVATEDEEPYERDTDAKEDVANLNTLLFPDGVFPVDKQRFSVSYNNALLQGWVKQPSPACAAASLAGAYNALAKLQRGDEKALHQPQVLDLYREILTNKLEVMKSKADHSIGADVEPLVEKLSSAMRQDEMSLGMKFPKGTKKKAIWGYIRGLVDDLSNEEDVFARLRTVYGEHAPKAVNGDGDDDDDDANDAEGDDNDDADGGNSIPKTGSGNVDEIELDAIPVSPKWKSTLYAYLGGIGGLEKLNRERPSTGYFGNWGIAAGCKLITQLHPVGLSHSPFMGKAMKGSKLVHRITSKDTEAAIEEQWLALVAAFNAQKTVLLFHLTNHYALIYATREWEEPTGEVVREVLTAKKGQRPSAWLPFQEIRKILLGWSGYQIMRITAR